MQRVASIITALLVASAEANPKIDCPPGYEYDGFECFKTISRPVKFECPKNFQMSNQGNKKEPICTNSLTSQPISECPEGYNYYQGSCTRTERVSPLEECPKGTTMSGKQCIIDETTNANIFCMKNFQLSKDRQVCERQLLIPPTLRCPEGYSGQGNECVREVRQKATKNCPRTYEYDGYNCVRMAQINGRNECPEGFRMNNNQCVRTETIPVGLRCPPNTVPDPTTGNCLATQVLSEAYACPSNDYKYNPEIDKCEIYVEVPPTCPSGYNFNARSLKCEFQKLAEPIEVCQDGSPLPCDRPTEVLAENTCPPDFADVNGQCSKIVVTDPVAVCPKGYKVAKSAPPAEKKTPPSNKKEQHSGVICEREEAREIVLTCPKDMALDNKTSECRALQVQPAVAVCPPDYEPHGQHCSSIKNAAPSVECPPGYTLDSSKKDDKCVRVRSVSPNVRCPEGYRTSAGDSKYNKDLTCTRIDSTKAYTICDKGFSLNPVRRICETSEETAALPSCPNGFMMEGDMCVKVEYTHPLEKKNY